MRWIWGAVPYGRGVDRGVWGCRAQIGCGGIGGGVTAVELWIARNDVEFVGVCRFCRFSDIPGSAQEQFAFYFSCLKIRSMLELFLYKITNSIHSSPPKTEKRSNISAAAMRYISAPTAISIAISIIISISLIFFAAILTKEQGHSSRSSNVDLGLTEARHRNPPDPVVQYTRVETKSNQYNRKQPPRPDLPTHSLEYNPNSYKKFTLV